jgi:hypothetical protein
MHKIDYFRPEIYFAKYKNRIYHIKLQLLNISETKQKA